MNAGVLLADANANKKKTRNSRKSWEVEGASEPKMGKLELWWGSKLVLRTCLPGSHRTFRF